MQSPGYNPERDLAHPEMLRASATLWLPASQALMLSFRHLDVSCNALPQDGGPGQPGVTVHTLTGGGRERPLWTRCGTLAPLPEVVVEVQGVRVEMITSRHNIIKGIKVYKHNVGHTTHFWCQ